MDNLNEVTAFREMIYHAAFTEGKDHLAITGETRSGIKILADFNVGPVNKEFAKETYGKDHQQDVRGHSGISCRRRCKRWGPHLATLPAGQNMPTDAKAA